ncbi:hypothetical protein EXS71_00840 [Candidatus Uhrbacteria bacterium]|nr:hypothetical protein [Candidatus Uhrbacteria bacterium]
MTRTFAMSMKRPHETLGLPQPIGRRLSEAGKKVWLVTLMVTAILALGWYIYEVNSAASRAYHLRALQTQSEQLEEQVTRLESQLAQGQTMRALQERVKTLGYVPVDYLEFVNVQVGGYAMAK